MTWPSRVRPCWEPVVMIRSPGPVGTPSAVIFRAIASRRSGSPSEEEYCRARSGFSRAAV